MHDYITFACPFLATVNEWGCEGASTFSMHICGCSHAWLAHVQLCRHVFAPPFPTPPPTWHSSLRRSFGSVGNATPVPGIAASLDPGNSDDRNRHLLPLQQAHCLATGSPHAFPKPFLKASHPSHFFSFFCHPPQSKPSQGWRLFSTAVLKQPVFISFA